MQRINLENESVKDQVMSDDLYPSKNNSYPNENSIDNFGIILKDLHCANYFSETQGSIINTLTKNKYQYSNYDFCYRRSAYRSMMDFYKDKFKPVLIEWKAGERRSVKSFVQDFISQRIVAQQQKSEESLKIEQILSNQQI